jgi:septal ring factor EnvC (AmiA/AmiB activator)
MAYSSEKFTDQLIKFWPIVIVLVGAIGSTATWGVAIHSDVSASKTKLQEYAGWHTNLETRINKKVAEAETRLVEKIDDLESVQKDVNDLNIKTGVLGEQIEAVKDSQKRTEEDVKETRKDIEKTKEKVDETNNLIRELIQQQAAPAPMPAPRPQYDYQYDYLQQPAPRPQYIPRQQYYY